MEVELYRKSAGALATLKSAPDQLTQATRNRDQDGAVDTYEDKRSQLDAQASKSVRMHAPAAMDKQYEFSSGDEDDTGFQTKPRDSSPPAPVYDFQPKESPQRSMGARDLLAKQAAKQKPHSGYEPKQDWSSEEKAAPWGEEKPTPWGKEDSWREEERQAPRKKTENPPPWQEEEKAPAWGLYPDLKPEKPIPKDYGFGVSSEEPQMTFRGREPQTSTKQPPAAEFGFSDSSDESDDFNPPPKAQDWTAGSLPPQRDTPGFVPPARGALQYPQGQPQGSSGKGPGQAKGYSQQSAFPQAPPQSYAPPQAFATMPPQSYLPSQAQGFPAVPPQAFPPTAAPGLPGAPPQGFPGAPPQGFPPGFPQSASPADYQAMMLMMQKQMFDYQNLLAHQSDPNDPFREADTGEGVVQAAARPQNNPFATGPPGRGVTGSTGPSGRGSGSNAGFGDLI